MIENNNTNTSQQKLTNRQIGFALSEQNKWNLALVFLNKAAREAYSNLQNDVQLLDLLGEAAYRANCPEALGPYQNYYKYPNLASHMARAFMMLGDLNSAKEFLSYAKDSGLKAALNALLNMSADIRSTAAAMLPVARQYPNLYYPEYWRALAAVADAVQDLELTRLAEQRSKAYAYKDPNIHFNQALRMLGHGEFRAGWRLYEWRLVPGANQSNRTQLDQICHWEGQNLFGKKLLIYLEQGLGDGLFSLRYVQPLIDQGAIVEIVARAPLVSIVQSSFPNLIVRNEDEVVVVDYWQNKVLPDYWVYALSIPYRSGLCQPMQTQKYLSVDKKLIEEAVEKIKSLNPKKLPVYTINWHGRIDTESDRSRAFTADEFVAVAGLDKTPCVVISIQKEIDVELLRIIEEKIKKSGGVFFHAGSLLTDFSKTAAWITASDRLLTCDTSVAHLGGAIGHPTTVFARNKSIWQWLRKKTNTNADNQDAALPAVWYDSVVVQYALAPEISWLIKPTGLLKDEENGKSKTEDTNFLPEKNDSFRQSGPFRFAGRNQK